MSGPCFTKEEQAHIYNVLYGIREGIFKPSDVMYNWSRDWPRCDCSSRPIDMIPFVGGLDPDYAQCPVCHCIEDEPFTQEFLNAALQYTPQ